MPTKYSESSLHRRCRSSHANVRSTIHPFATTLNSVTSSHLSLFQASSHRYPGPKPLNLPPYSPSAQINVNSVAVRLLLVAPIWHHLDLVCPQLGLINLELIPTYQPEDVPFWPLFFAGIIAFELLVLSFLPLDY